MQLYW